MKLCHDCGQKFKRIGTHWVQSDCNYQNMTDEQYQIATGLIMGDGSIDKSSANPKIKCSSTNREYLEYLSDKFGILSGTISLERTSAEIAKQTSDRLKHASNDKENYNHVYRWTSVRLPELKQFSDWYKSGSKVWPDNLSLTPIVLKNWFCCDGYTHQLKNNKTIGISLSNERNNKKKINNYFSRAGLPEPNRWHEFDRKSGGIGCNVEWNKDESITLYKYMGKPISGFEHKWTTESFK